MISTVQYPKYHTTFLLKKTLDLTRLYHPEFILEKTDPKSKSLSSQEPTFTFVFPHHCELQIL